MTEWIETVRGTVSPWECDITEHFTIGCYAERLDQASTTLADVLDLAEQAQAGVYPRRFTWRFLRELRAGASFQIESAVIGIDPCLRFGHRFIDSANCEIVTWIEEIWENAVVPEARHEALSEALAQWDGPAIEKRAEPVSMEGAIATGRGRVRPADLDEFSRFSLAAFVHRFTDGILQALAAIRFSGDYIKAERRGYSTFELALRIAAAPCLGDRYLVKTGITHLGNSSIQFFHQITDARSGHELARLGQFGVQLDLDARRPAPLPAMIRAAAARLLLSGTDPQELPS